MKKIFYLLFAVSFCDFSVYAQSLQSPEQYMDVKQGERFNFHHKLIDYVKYVAETQKTTTKLIQYGTTTEGRPQVIIAIGTEENIKNLEEIRKANMINNGLMQGTKNTNIPAIAMLSYNVHGNEAVNAETSVHVVYELANGTSSLAKKVLANTVVLLDPCVNPDGFDRYSQWYNRYVAVTPNADPAAVEHHEPWPGGRYNHYLYDMNRDLAWQTQREVQNRMKFYNSWLPHLHADFHEMGPNSTYYFAPSAKPFHEDLTEYQRKFQNLLGDYNSKRFDQKGWLYYTKENYDLFYPSYGDTYPSYNGAIGMTFEQAGGGAGGLAFARTDEDTLTLKDRISHSFSTSMGTLEALSDNANKVKDEYYKFFNESAQKGYGKYKSFVLKYEGNEAKIAALSQQLDKIGVQYSFANKKSTNTGYNYLTQKEESFSVAENDMILSTYQPKGVLTKILFEPNSYLEDSNTYDITAWALPYAYGIDAYAVTQKLDGGKKEIVKSTNNINAEVTDVYAFAVPITSFENTKFLAQIFQTDIKVRIHEAPFTAEGKSFKHGTLIISKKGNESLGKSFETKVMQIAKENNTEIFPLKSGMVSAGSDLGAGAVSPLKSPNVAMLIGDGVTPTTAGDVWHYFEQQIKYPITLIEGSYFSKVDLWKFDVLILTNGKYSNIIKDHKEITRWVSDGGRLILIESANGFFADKDGIELKSKKASGDAKMPATYADRERYGISDQIPGAIYNVKLDNTHPLAYGYSDHTFMLVKSVNNFEYLSKGWNVGKLDSKSYLTGFAGKRAKEQMKDVPLFAVQDLGKGKVIHLIENPIFRSFWYEGKLLFGNSIFLVK